MAFLPFLLGWNCVITGIICFDPEFELDLPGRIAVFPVQGNAAIA
jgi:hypothetical protein